MKILAVLGFVAAIFGSSAAAAASHVEQCDGALAKDIYDSSTHYTVDWRLATLVTRDEWNQSNQGGGVNAVIYGIPVGASYDDYKNNVSQFMASHNESLNIDYSRSIAWQELSANDLAAYEACLAALRAGAPGFYLTADHAERDKIILTVYYEAGAHDPNEVKLQWGGDKSVLPPDAPKKIFHNVQTTIALKRPATGSVVLTVNAPGIPGDSIVIPSYPPKPLPIWLLSIGGADDHISCSINGQQVGSRGITDPTLTVNVNGFVKAGSNILQCAAQDLQGDGHGNPCWSYGYSLYEDGYLETTDSDRQCGPGARAQPDVQSRTFVQPATDTFNRRQLLFDPNIAGAKMMEKLRKP
jgi:hypothetical protein